MLEIKQIKNRRQQEEEEALKLSFSFTVPVITVLVLVYKHRTLLRRRHPTRVIVAFNYNLAIF
jgi:hypothetical protein